MASFFKEWKAQRKAEREKVITPGKLFKYDLPENPRNYNYAFAEELLTPHLSNCDTQRENMFSSHFSQTVHLVNPEYPKVFTNFEDQIGEYSVSYKKAKDNFTIIAKLQKNALNYDLIVQYNQSKEYDVIHYRRATHITEEYGYGMDDCLKDKKVGDKVSKDAFLSKCPSYDDSGNFRYGTNLKTAYLCWFGLTYEDAIVVSKSAAEKLKSYKCEETIVSINNNDALLNLYPATPDLPYHAFPHVGEYTDGNVLTATRREEKQNILFNFEYDKMKRLEPTDNITYSNGGIVADLDIYCNTPISYLEKNQSAYNQELLCILKEQNAYYENAKTELEKILPVATEAELKSTMTADELSAYNSEYKEFGFNWERPQPASICKNHYSEEFGYFWKVVHEYLDDRIKWRSKGKSFTNYKLKFTILKENPLRVGCKITGRYGNKSVVSKIENDEDMPIASNGIHADVVANSLGVVNRMNPAQLQEHTINFISDHVLTIIKATKDVDDKIDLLLSYINYLDKEEHDFLESETIMMNRAQKEDFIKDIEDHGIFMHQDSFFKNAKEPDFERLISDHPEWVTKYNCTVKGMKIERPIVIGDIYFIRLKHESSNKCSFVSADATNMKDQPSKSTSKKDHKTLFMKTPVRFGEMEADNALLTKRGDIVSKLFKSYSTSKDDREQLIKQLLLAPNPFNINVAASTDKSISRTMLDRYLDIPELALVDSDEDDFSKK